MSKPSPVPAYVACSYCRSYSLLPTVSPATNATNSACQPRTGSAVSSPTARSPAAVKNIAVELFESKAQTLLDQANAHRGLSSSLAHANA